MEIGAPVTATDANDDTLTYALGGTDTASFDIDTATGQLMTVAALDYETKATYSVTVTASDSGGLSDSIDVTITVTNEDDTLLERFDTDVNGVSGEIDKSEVIMAINDYIDEIGGVTKKDVIDVINLYLDS